MSDLCLQVGVLFAQHFQSLFLLTKSIQVAEKFIIAQVFSKMPQLLARMCLGCKACAELFRSLRWRLRWLFNYWRRRWLLDKKPHRSGKCSPAEHFPDPEVQVSAFRT